MYVNGQHQLYIILRKINLQHLATLATLATDLNDEQYQEIQVCHPQKLLKKIFGDKCNDIVL